MTYLAPKNNITQKIGESNSNFSGYIDKFKKDDDCITIDQIDLNNLDKIIIYSPEYYKEIYVEFKTYIPENNITFFIGFGQTTRSLAIASYIYELTKKWAKIKKIFKNYSKCSETSKIRDVLSPFCSGNGIDIGFGGDPIIKSAITVDLPSPYAKYKNNPLHLRGSGDNLYWFKDNVLDYVYSSHLLEDFEHTKEVINEWLRVIKVGGNLVLFLPDEQVYREYNKKLGKNPNHNHVHDHFSLEFIKDIIKLRDDVKIIHEVAISNIYSFELVIKKIK